jgi:hypothetical protein
MLIWSAYRRIADEKTTYFTHCAASAHIEPFSYIC